MARLSKNPRNYLSVMKLLWRSAIERSRKTKQGRPGSA
jgi:hypothetical protein